MSKQKIVVGVLTHNRPKLLLKTLQSFYENFSVYKSQFKTIIFDNGSTTDVIDKNRILANKYGASFFSLGEEKKLPKDSKTRDNNISLGHNKLINLMKQELASAYIILEDDWECTSEAPLNELIKLLHNNPSIGQIRLRNCKYDGSLKGCANHNFVTLEPIKWTKTIELERYQLDFGNLHWVNNPSIISKKALELVSKGFSSELECMRAFAEHYPNNIQLSPGIFEHIGPWRHREDLKEQGII